MNILKRIDHRLGRWVGGTARAAAVVSFAATFALTGEDANADASLRGDMLGSVQSYTAKHEDTLLDLARDNGLGFVEIVAANQGIDPWVPGEGTEIVLPTGHILPDAPREA